MYIVIKEVKKSRCKFAIMRLEITGIFLQFWHVKIRDRMNTCLWWHMFKSNIEKILSCLLVSYTLHMLLIKEVGMYPSTHIRSMYFNIDCKVKTSFFFYPTFLTEIWNSMNLENAGNLSFPFYSPCLKKVMLAKI